jgi:hypothetical protein
MTQGQTEIATCTLIFVVVELAVAYIVLEWKQPPSRQRTFGLSLAWCLILFFPWVLIFAYADAVWPYGHDYAPIFHQNRWDWMIRDAVSGTLATVAFGLFVGWLLCKASPTQNGHPPDTTLPHAGPLWSAQDRRLSHKDKVESARDGVCEQ